MVGAVADALKLDAALYQRGLRQRRALSRWVFDVGAAHFDSVAGRFRSELARL
jgi:hypothetical protein